MASKTCKKKSPKEFQAQEFNFNFRSIFYCLKSLLHKLLYHGNKTKKICKIVKKRNKRFLLQTTVWRITKQVLFPVDFITSKGEKIAFFIRI